MRNKKGSQLEIERIERRYDNMNIIGKNDENFILINWNRERERVCVCVCVIIASVMKKSINRERKNYYCIGYGKNLITWNKKGSQLGIERIQRRYDNVGIIGKIDKNLILITWRKNNGARRKKESQTKDSRRKKKEEKTTMATYPSAQGHLRQTPNTKDSSKLIPCHTTISMTSSLLTWAMAEYAILT